MYTLRSKYWPAYTWKIQTSYLKDFKDRILGGIKISEEDFGKTYFYIFHKINASFYHLQRLKENQETAIGIGQELAKNKIPGTENLVGIAGVPFEPIEYEYETLLVTIKSALDLISILVSKSFGRKEDNISSLLNNIKSKKSGKGSLEEQVYAFLESDQFTDLINSFRSPNAKKGKKSKRDFAVHRGSLPIGTINIPINNPNASVLLPKALDQNTAESHFPLSNSPNLVDYCENQFYQTCDLLIGILSILSGSQLKPGPKISVYEQKIGLKKNVTEGQ